MESLLEFLDNSADFTYTTNTNPPKRYAAITEINGTTYHLDVSLSTFQKVFLVDFGRLSSAGLVRHWSIRSNDVRPALAAFVKMMNAILPQLKQRANGFLIRVPGKIKTEKYFRLIKLLLRKSRDKSLRVVPVDDATNGTYKYMFLIRKTLSPKAVFSGKEFSGYTFDPKVGIDGDAFSDIKLRFHQSKIKSREPIKDVSTLLKNVAVETSVPDSKALINAKVTRTEIKPENGDTFYKDDKSDVKEVSRVESGLDFDFTVPPPWGDLSPQSVERIFFHDVTSTLIPEHLEASPEFKWLESNRDSPMVEAVKHYSGDFYAVFNNNLRKPHDTYQSHITKDRIPYIFRAFDEIPKSERAIWTYRTLTVKKRLWPIDEIMFDAGLQSTSVNVNMNWGWASHGTLDEQKEDGNFATRLAIYVPEGSSVIPLLSLAEIPRESEVILPPGSIYRPLIVHGGVINGHAVQLIICVYLGNVRNYVKEKVDAKQPIFESMILDMETFLTEHKDDRSFQKWNQPIASSKDSKFILNALKSSKIALQR